MIIAERDLFFCLLGSLLAAGETTSVLNPSVWYSSVLNLSDLDSSYLESSDLNASD